MNADLPCTALFFSLVEKSYLTEYKRFFLRLWNSENIKYTHTTNLSETHRLCYTKNNIYGKHCSCMFLSLSLAGMIKRSVASVSIV